MTAPSEPVPVPDRLTTEPQRGRCPQLAIRPGFHGPCHAGHMRCVRAVKRSEAKQRATSKNPAVVLLTDVFQEERQP